MVQSEAEVALVESTAGVAEKSKDVGRERPAHGTAALALPALQGFV